MTDVQSNTGDSPGESRALAYWQETANEYTRASLRARWAFYASETVVLVVAAAIPVTAAFTADRRVPAVLGAVVVIVTGLRALFRWRDTWTRAIEVIRQLEIEKELYLARAGIYAGSDRDVRLIERVVEIRRTETSGWIALRTADDTAGKAGAG